LRNAERCFSALQRVWVQRAISRAINVSILNDNPMSSGTKLQRVRSIRLSIPEYMEAWLRVPDGVRMDFYHDSNSENSFCISLKCFDTNRSIFCSRLRTKPDRIALLWRTVEADTVFPSVVDIMLRDGPRLHSPAKTWWASQLGRKRVVHHNLASVVNEPPQPIAVTIFNFAGNRCQDIGPAAFLISLSSSRRETSTNWRCNLTEKLVQETHNLASTDLSPRIARGICSGAVLPKPRISP
jgi:hypothetical protein